MIVVADSSCFIALVKIGHTDVLPQMFGSVVIPPKVAAELADPDGPQDVRSFALALPPWVSVERPSRVAALPGLHRGEQEAISLAIELNADLLIIDDRRGHKAASQRGLQTARATTILLQAAQRGLLDLRQAFDQLRETDFRVTDKILEELLRRHPGGGENTPET